MLPRILGALVLLAHLRPAVKVVITGIRYLLTSRSGVVSAGAFVLARMIGQGGPARRECTQQEGSGG